VATEITPTGTNVSVTVAQKAREEPMEKEVEEPMEPAEEPMEPAEEPMEKELLQLSAIVTPCCLSDPHPPEVCTERFLSFDECVQILECPHCGGGFLVEELNCGIFRHGLHDATGTQLPPHASEDECRQALAANTGCGKPFQITKDACTGMFTVAKCAWI
jgi:hypothetical protein